MKLQFNQRIICYVCVIYIACILIHDGIWGYAPVAGEENIQGVTDGASVILCGEIYQIEQKEYSQYIYIKEGTKRWLLYDASFQELSLGNIIQVTGQLKLFDVARNPGNFDAKEYYNRQGLIAGVSTETIEVVNDKVFFVRDSLYRLRLKGVERIYEILGEEQGGLLVAMIFGETNGMNPELKELYQKVGISHIFAISGLHISLLSLVVYQMIRRMTGSFAIGGIISGMFLAMYVVMIGLGISAIRASIMFILRIGADISGRVYDIRISLAVAAMCILSMNSNYLYDGGFLLSFGAILGVIYVVPIWKDIFTQCIEKHEKWKYYKQLQRVMESLSASVGIQCVMLPISFYFFYEISPYSILLNLLVIPLMTVLLGVAMLGLLGSLLWYGAGAILLLFSGWLLQVIELISNAIIQIPFARIVVGQPWAPILIVYYLAVLGILGYWKILSEVECDKLRRVKRKRIVGVIMAILPLVFGIHDSEYYNSQVAMLDIGQGDCFYIKGPEGQDYLIDGGSSDIKEVGKYRIEPYLRSIGVEQLEYVFISHGDSDHYNGVEEMLMRQDVGVRIRTLVVCQEKFWDENLRGLVGVAIENGTEVVMIQDGDVIREGELSLSYVAPCDTYTGEIGNASSMVLKLELASLKMLFTGDVEGEGEEALIEKLRTENLESGTEQGVQILKVAHHGSKNSTTEEMLQILTPQIGLISAGTDSVYGHPHEETIERLNKYSCTIYSTPINGGVILSYNINDDKINIYKTIE